MKKRIGIWMIIFILIFGMISPATVDASELYAFAREAVPYYSDAYGSSTDGSIPKYKGCKVEQKTGNYYFVTYQQHGTTKKGWISSSDYKDWFLEYDGSEIPLIASGEYYMGNQNVIVTAIGGQKYYIQLKGNKEYLSASGNQNHAILTFESEKKKDENIWVFERREHHFMIRNEKTGLYLVPNGSVIQMKDPNHAKAYSWIFVRKDTNVNPYRNFLQYDGRWGNQKYGNSTKMAASACGVLAVVNAAYALNGQFIDPMDAAEYACEKHYRVEYNGTDEAFLSAFVKDLGEEYGISYQGEAETLSEIRQALQTGKIVVAHVPGHYVCIADYDAKKERYLILDSHPIPKRKTSPFGSWVSEKRLINGGLLVSNAFIYAKKKDAFFHWNLNQQELEVLEKIAFTLGSDEREIIFQRLCKQEGIDYGKME